MRVLLGTTNPSKVKRFEELMSGYGIEFCTLRDLGINTEPEECGKTPEENAIIKAKYYGKYCDMVICNDSGLYFDDIPFDDKRQPGLNIRTPEGKRLSDEEMIHYYSSLVASLEDTDLNLSSLAGHSGPSDDLDDLGRDAVNVNHSDPSGISS